MNSTKCNDVITSGSSSYYSVSTKMQVLVPSYHYYYYWALDGDFGHQ